MLEILKLSQDDIKAFKKATIRFLSEIIKDFNQEKTKSNLLEFEQSRLIIEDFSQDSLSSYIASRLKIHPIRRCVLGKLKENKYSYYNDLLTLKNIFTWEKHEKMPYNSLFEVIILNYFKKATEQTKNNGPRGLFPLKFNETLFENCWKPVENWIKGESIEVILIYLIFNVELKVQDYEFDEQKKLKLILPSKKERLKLLEEIRSEKINFEGRIKVENRLQSFLYSGNWILGKLELKINQIEEKEMFFDYPHPIHIMEAFSLLGYTNAKVCFCTFTNPLYPYDISIKPIKGENYAKIYAYENLTLRRYPELMEANHQGVPKENVKLSNAEMEFLSSYPIFRRNLDKYEVTRIALSRFYRSINSVYFVDKILEVVIGMEILLITKQVTISKQFRDNISWLISSNHEERKKIELLAKDIYSLRCEIIHNGGRKGKIDKIAKTFGGVRNIQALAIDLFRLVIMSFFQIEKVGLTFKQKNEVLAEIEKYKSKENIKRERNALTSLMYEKFIRKLNEILSN